MRREKVTSTLSALFTNNYQVPKDPMTTKEITAEEFKAGLPRQVCGRKGVLWTLETYSTYVNLLYPHITVVLGQEWIGIKTKYQFLCSKHGEYSARADNILEPSKGCHCKGCQVDNATNSAGKRRCPRATPEEKQRAAELRAEGLSYEAIGRTLGRSDATILRWLDPECKERHRQCYTAWLEANRERHKAAKRRYCSEFSHGKAGNVANSATRRLLKTNAPEYVFIDNTWHEVDRKETYRVFKDSLLPVMEREGIKKLYLDAQKLTEQTGVEHHVDHIHPLAKGGEHLLYNLQILTAEENLSKQATFSIEDQATICNYLFH
jgi:hypothetical protein